jgi:D-alanyl-D-alanine carboxypeptidase/D-alanyl-D-alanine-endopeptidase (penicillin-binding protein 4)
MDRLKAIFPLGDSGTMKNYYKTKNGRDGQIFAKTGSMSGVVALSGFLYTRNNRLLIFSILVNNFEGKAAPVRRAIEKYLLTF